MKGIIYKYTSPSGKVYIGKTVNERVRKNQHKSTAKTRKTYFARAILKYGFENLSYEVIIRFNPTTDKDKLNRVLSKLEKRYIKLYNSNVKDFGYNLTSGGEGTPGYIYTPEQKQRLREQSAKEGRSKQVFQFSIKKEFIRSFVSIQEAAESLKGNTPLISKRISEVCNNKWESAYNYIWSFSPKLQITNYSWITDILEDREYSLTEIREIFIPELEKRNLKVRKGQFIKDYFPEYSKKEKWKEGKRDMYYKFKL